MKKRGTIKEQENTREEIVRYLIKNSKDKSRMTMAAKKFGVTRPAVYKIWKRFENNRMRFTRQLDSVKSNSRGKNNRYNEMVQEVEKLIAPYVNERDAETGEKVIAFGRERYYVQDVETLNREIRKKFEIETSRLQMRRCLDKFKIMRVKRTVLWSRVNSEENLKRLRSFQYQAKKHNGQEIWIYKSVSAKNKYLVASNDRGYFRFMSIGYRMSMEGFQHFLKMLILNSKKKLYMVVIDIPAGNKKNRKELQEWISEESQSLEVMVIPSKLD